MGCNVGKSILVIGILRNSSWSIIDNYYLMTHTWEFYLHCQYLWRQKSHKTSRKHAFFYVLVLMHLSRRKNINWFELNLKCYTLLCQTNTYQSIIFSGKIALWQIEANVKLENLVYTNNTWMPFILIIMKLPNRSVCRKVEIIFIQTFFFWEQCEKSDHDCLGPCQARCSWFFVDARGFFSRSS